MSHQSNNNKRLAKNALLPNALYDGGVAVYEPSHIECIGSGRLRNIDGCQAAAYQIVYIIKNVTYGRKIHKLS